MLWTLIVFVGGFYCGLAATKRAFSGPAWIRHAMGVDTITLPPAGPPPPGPALPNTGQAVNPNPPIFNAPPSAGPSNAPNTGGAPPNGPGAPNTAGTNNAANAPAPNSQKQQTGQENPDDTAPAPSGTGLAGTWEITDELHPTGSKASKVTSQYVFDPNGTGEFDTNGKKMYDLQWEDAGDYLAITFITDEGGADNWKVKLKYSLNADKSLLTLAPEGKKDPRGEMYNVGPGVFHRK